MTIRNKAALLGAELTHRRDISLRRATITSTDENTGTVRVKFGGTNGTELDYDLPVVGSLPKVDDPAYVIVAGKKLICLSVGFAGGSKSVVKTADETITSSAALQDDDDLVLPVDANAAYAFTLHLILELNTSPDFQYDFSYPAGSEIGWSAENLVGTSFNASGTVKNVSTVQQLSAASAGVQTLVIRGGLIVGDTGGSLQFRWGPRISSANPTRVKKFSTMTLTKAS